MKKASDQELQEIRDIGAITAQSIVDFFENEKNIEMINNLNSLGVSPKESIIEVVEDSFFTNKTVVITGSFENYNRKELKEKLESLGAKVTGSVSNNTDIVVYGESAGSKYDRAVSLNKQLMNESEFISEVSKNEKDA